MSATDSLRAAMRRAGLDYTGPLLADGRLHRVRVEGDRERNSWYVLHAGPPMAGAFGCWKRGTKETWCERSGHLSQAEWNEVRRRWQEADRERELIEAKRHEEARKEAALILSRATAAHADHPYLAAKGVQPHGELHEDNGDLVPPLRDANGTLHSLQRITADWEKLFLKSGRVAGTLFTLSKKSDGPLVLCEGYATGASVHESTGFATVCAMNCGNLPAVAQALRGKWPEREIIIAADNDQFTEGNPGLSKATEAAKAIRAKLAVPQFSNAATKPTDFNDLHQLEGIDTVKQQIETAALPTETHSETSEAKTPTGWFKNRFPKLAERHGEPLLETQGKKAELPRVVDVCEDFIAATLGEDGQPETPTVFIPAEERFYTYEPSQGVFHHRREPELSAQISRLYLECARACQKTCDVSKLEFGLRDTSALTGILRRARAVLSVDDDFFNRDVSDFIAVANGMLQLADRELLPFSPSYRRRNKLAVSFDADARCPLFLDTLMRPALEDDDVSLVQRWCGLALLGEDLAQRLLMLIGTAGSGKGALVRVVCGIVGETNLASLRTGLLAERFELGRYIGRTLLYGADVPDDFLNHKSASVLKALTGGDPVTVELKNSNEVPGFMCRFNVIITSNSRLTVHLEGDTDAWRRRLVIVRYTRQKPAHVIPNLSERILREEGSGVLNWMMDGLDHLRKDNWQLSLNERQQRIVDDLLLESEGHREFVRRCLTKDSNATLQLNDAFTAYVDFCNDRGWEAISRNRFGRLIPDTVVQEHRVILRRDIKDAAGKAQQGWKSLCLSASSQWSEKKASEPSAHSDSNASSEASEDLFSPQSKESSVVQPSALVEELA